MRQEKRSEKENKQTFAQIIQKAYENGLMNQEITVGALVEQLKLDLKESIFN